jgi:hypothetical protein
MRKEVLAVTLAVGACVGAIAYADEPTPKPIPRLESASLEKRIASAECRAPPVCDDRR